MYDRSPEWNHGYLGADPGTDSADPGWTRLARGMAQLGYNEYESDSDTPWCHVVAGRIKPVSGQVARTVNPAQVHLTVQRGVREPVRA